MFPQRNSAKKPKLFRRTPPPNYQQRSTKLKVFAAVAAVILVLFIFEKARDPQALIDWYWRKVPESPQLENRIIPKSQRVDEPGTITQTSRQVEEEPAIEDERQPEPAELTWRQGWKEIYAALDATERTLLFEILAQGRGEHELSPAALELAKELVIKLDDQWKAYGESAFQSLAALQPEERSSWESVLRTANERWTKESQPALEAAAQGVAVTGDQRVALNHFQKSLDWLNLALVKDDSPLRPDENDIWFRLMLEAHRTPPEELKQQSDHDVTYIQMFKQSAHYRGDLITARGLVRGGWKMPAVTNPWGLKEYYVLWVHPLVGPNAPMIVHVQTLPEGFPEIKERSLDGSYSKLHEDVTVTGYFFKRQAYPAADGTRTAPLLLAGALEWNKTPVRAGFEMTLPLFLWIAAGTLGISLLCAGLIYWRIREQDKLHIHDDDIAKADISALKDVQLTPTVSEALRQMEEEHKRQ